MPRNVLAITYRHENGALLNASHEYCTVLKSLGYEADCADLSTADGSEKLKKFINSEDAYFAFGLQGVGSQLRRNDQNLWLDARIPFISLQFDNPCCNPDNHSGNNPYVANLYHFESFLDIQRRYIGGEGITGLLPFEVPLPISRPEFAFDERPIKLLYLKSGNTLDEYVEYFDKLPPALRDGVWQITEDAKKDPNISLCDRIESLLTQNGYDLKNYRAQFWAVMYAMDSYLRRKRAIDFVNWLKFQPGAVILGDGWDFIDRTGAHADFRAAAPYRDAGSLYERSQFLCNTSPYGRDIVHERIVLGLAMGCCVLTDTNAWWDKNFADVPPLNRFGWDLSLEEQLRPVIDAPARAAQASLTGREPALRKFNHINNMERILACVDDVRRTAADRLKI